MKMFMIKEKGSQEPVYIPFFCNDEEEVGTTFIFEEKEEAEKAIKSMMETKTIETRDYEVVELKEI